ncbi:MAG: Trk system potassium transporter TrkA, partial [Planctomycetota bacterium]
LEIYELNVAPKSEAVGSKLRDLRLAGGVRVGSIAREGRMWIASGEDEIQEGDRVSLVGMPDAVAKARDRFSGGKESRSTKRVMIAGGGETGYHLARSLGTHDYRVAILERDPHRCETLAKLLPHATVVHANANRRSLLEDEGAGTVDFFVACSGHDESNIMACVEARELGAARVMCVVGRADYANVVGKLGIDRAVSERDVVARQILGFMKEGSIISHRRLPNDAIGVYELEIVDRTRVTQAALADLPLSGRCLLAAMQRDGFIRVPTADDQLQAGDIVVALVDESVSDEILSLFNDTVTQ